MKLYLFLLLIPTLLINPDVFYEKAQESNQIKCTDNGCMGTYTGPEFISGSDIAHQFSNKMSGIVGNKLKELYRDSNFKKVDFSKIKMSTVGMGSGNVTYTLSIPFMSVEFPCEAYTSFDHVGGWNHKPALERRKHELRNVTLKGHSLDVSDLKQTNEGLQEYWIQWKNKEIQKECE